MIKQEMYREIIFCHIKNNLQGRSYDLNTLYRKMPRSAHVCQVLGWKVHNRWVNALVIVDMKYSNINYENKLECYLI